jgi:hypothetical protein
MTQKTTGPEDRKEYRAPRLVTVADVAEVLDVLGPAQASYGSTGLG